MKFLNAQAPPFELTYNDVFMIPNASDVRSRWEADLTPADGTGATFPIVVANMNAVAGKRMAETVARRGGLTVLSQDVPVSEVATMIAAVKECHPIYETPIVLTAERYIRDALDLMLKRSHRAAVIVDDKNYPIGVVVPEDCEDRDLFQHIGEVMSANPEMIKAGVTPKAMFEWFLKHRWPIAPVVGKGGLVGIMTQKGALRSSLYKPALDKNGKLMVATAVGINGKPAERARKLLDAGADVIVVDTAHGDQVKTIEAIKAVRKVAGSTVKIVAGNIVTADGTRRLIDAGADIVKVGVGPGAMCTTRMMTGVGRPQFSAVLECAAAAREAGGHIWADGGVKYPRDVALALAAGASSVMIGSWFAGTYESAGDPNRDSDGRLYKESFGMASRRAVINRTHEEDPLQQARKGFFQEGISNSRFYIDPERPGVEDIIDQINAGLRSAMTYAGAHSLEAFHDKAIIGVQSSSGYQEGRPVDTNW